MTTDPGDGPEVDGGTERRRLLAIVGRAFVGGGLLAALAPTVAGADTALDVQILQTASSLEALAAAAYGYVLGEGPEGADAPAARAVSGISVANARSTMTTFATESRRQHGQHKKAFQDRTTALGGRVQDAPNPKFLPLLAAADLGTPDSLATLEKVVADTYLLNLPVLQDVASRAVMAGVLALGAQRLATVRLLGSLLAGGSPHLVAIPFPLGDLLKLPSTAGSVATPDALHAPGGSDLVAEPASGAVS
jgi:hypothetical protein